MKTIIQELESLSSDGIYCMAKIEWWLLKHYDKYKKVKEEESQRFMYLLDGEWYRLPDYFDARTPNEKFLRDYDILDKVSEYQKEETYFKQEMSIYKDIKAEPERVRQWLTKNEHLGVDKYFLFLLDYFGDEDTMENELHLEISFLENDKDVIIDREDFKYTMEFTYTFHGIYWDVLKELNIFTLNTISESNLSTIG